MGFEEGDYQPPIAEIWAENVQTLNLFTRLMTQWRVSMSGAVGLDYNVLFHELDRMPVDQEEYEVLFDCIRIMEAEALAQMKNG